jgi:hypothetical protein
MQVQVQVLVLVVVLGGLRACCMLRVAGKVGVLTRDVIPAFCNTAVALPNSSLLALSTLTTCPILMHLVAMVQDHAASNFSKFQLDATTGTYLDRPLEVQST